MPADLQQQLSTSRKLAAKIREQRKTIADNDKYLREQEELIQTTINTGNNHILQLTKESDELQLETVQARKNLIKINADIDDKRFELLNLGGA